MAARGDGASPGQGQQYENLRAFLEAIESAIADLDHKQMQAVDVETVAAETLERVEADLLQPIEDRLQEDRDTLAAAVEATDQALDETTASAGAIEDAGLPAALKRLEELPAQLDAAVDPARAELVSRFEGLGTEGFALTAEQVRQAGAAVESAGDGGSGLQAFLELAADLHALAESHASGQHEEAAAVDDRAAALSDANETTHAAAEAGARLWGEACAGALEGHCDTHADEVRVVYANWDIACAPQGAEVERALESAVTRLEEALGAADGAVDRETEDAQGALDGLHGEMKDAHERMDGGRGILEMLLEEAVPGLGTARRVVDRMKDLMDALGS